MLKYNRKHIGEVHLSGKGEVIYVVDGGSKRNYCTILLDNREYEVKYCHVKDASIKNPYCPNIYDKGYLGVGKAIASVNRKESKSYKVWKSILERVYSAKSLAKYPTYIGVKVCEEWHNFQVFDKWFQKNFINGYALDKDLLSGDTKIYSPETCIFLPPALNSFFTNKRRGNTSNYIGVYWHKGDKRWRTSISDIHSQKKIDLGCYDTQEEANEAYQTKRAEFALVWKKRMKEILPKEAIDNIK